LPWAARRWKIDTGRVSLGNAILAMHLPELITYAEAGGYQSITNYKWSPLGRGLVSRFGPYDTSRTSDQEKSWDLLDVALLASEDPAGETPFLWCPGGKGDGHEMETGWAQNPRVWRVLTERRRPFAAAWGGVVRGFFGDPPPRFRQMRYDHNVPAFGHCCLDDNPGSGSIYDGDLAGQINGYLWWDPDTGVDQKDRWALTVYLVDEAPEGECTADVTPRRLTNFKPKTGETFKWTNTSVKDGKLVRSGTVTADKWGLLTLPQITVTKGKNRLEIARQ
ncbi:MAG: hypothetical protein GY953_40440, partial [bacterium]|nr:hypothetical protein [bacterium]